MLSLRTTILLALAAAAPSVLSHTWGEQLRNINDQGQYVGAYGYMRGYRVRGGPDYNEDALVQRMPASNGEGKTFITADQLLCHENQREQKQASDKFPRLQTTPGSFVAIKYQENGHITTADTIKGKPEKGGSVYVYGTTDPKSDEKLVDVLQWTHDGKGGDKRGVLLAINDYDDGRCYLNNESSLHGGHSPEWASKLSHVLRDRRQASRYDRARQAVHLVLGLAMAHATQHRGSSQW
jgi:hypothetical protein